LVVGVPMGALADDATNTPPAATPAAPKVKAAAFRGTLGAVDKAAMMITVENKNGTKRMFAVTSDTKIMKGSAPATLDDATVGDAVSGSYTKTDDGKMVAKTLRFGAKSAPAAPAPAPAK
jgi:hypothetical protein